MKGIKEVKNKGQIAYRVQKMIKGVRYDKTFDNEVAAKIYLSKLNGQPHITVGFIVKRYADKCPVSDYRGVMRMSSFWIEKIGHLYVYEVSHKLVDQVIAEHIVGAGLSETTGDRYRSMLSMCYQHANMHGLNPCRNMSYSNSVKIPKVYSVHQLYAESY